TGAIEPSSKLSPRGTIGQIGLLTVFRIFIEVMR
ncbi:hypothetical protein D030_1876B, partial [Vibrio parahaemolyticus AQ3810]